MNTNKVSIVQKILVFIFMGILISTFYIARNNKIEKLKTNNLLMTSQIEDVITNSLTFLYNEDLATIKEISTIHADYTEILSNKFSSVNSTLANANMYLSNIKLSKNRIYSTRKKSVKYIIYDGIINLKWTSNDTNIETDGENKNIKAYLIQKDNNYYLANIDITNTN